MYFPRRPLVARVVVAVALATGCDGDKLATAESAAPGASSARAGSSASARTSADPPGDAADVAALRTLLLDYKKAIYARKGDEAAALAAIPTHQYFEAARKDALTTPEADVRKKPLMDRLMILVLRARVPAERLRTLDGKGLFAHAVNEGMVGEEARSLEPGDILVDGTVGKIGIRAGKDVVPPTSGFRAYREEGVWKLDVMSISKLGGVALQQALKDVDPDIDKALVTLVEASAGRPLGADIWKPLDPPK